MRGQQEFLPIYATTVSRGGWCLECPSAGLAPAGFHFRDAEVAVAVGAEEFGSIPFEQVVRRTAHARRRGERAKTLLTACLLVEE